MSVGWEVMWVGVGAMIKRKVYEGICWHRHSTSPSLGTIKGCMHSSQKGKAWLYSLPQMAKSLKVAHRGIPTVAPE